MVVVLRGAADGGDLQHRAEAIAAAMQKSH
jgi:hypothetical protein